MFVNIVQIYSVLNIQRKYLKIEAVVRRCSIKKVFLEISQNSQEKACARVSFLIKLQASGIRPVTLLKKRLCRRCFSVNFSKFLKNTFSYRAHPVAASVRN